jgi:hypothetical protein
MAILGEFPRPLGRLAVVWLVIGILSLLRLLSLRVDIGLGGFDIGVLGLMFGPGLFLAQPWARRWLIWLTRLGFAFVGIFIFALAGAEGAGVWLGFTFSAVVVLLLLVQRRVLMRPDVQRWFDPYGRVE